ncbi:hypothetical protein J2847_006820 [Azospirillum agricola]|uniref:hypothetical protein n=1 Tax=Azospirillum agricola TaxID=1720247 RepID=UPI001AE202E2|nr:hypothetical protein [Azospirillum agricola]MBP2233481.1 hypothetical protein [Azospirillum agricola]
MPLLDILAVTSADEVDPTRPLQLGPLELGVEAATEAFRILSGGEFSSEVQIDPQGITRAFYWAIAHKTEGSAEIFGFPVGTVHGLPTAIEIAIVRAVAASTPDQHDAVLAGGMEISIGPAGASTDFRRIIRVVERPMAGDSLLFDGATQAVIDENINALLSRVALKCLDNSLRTSPLKFRFLELYRVMEARFLAEIKVKLVSSFDAEPSAALSDAVEALKSEMNQIIGLAETQQDAFEACWTALDQIKNTNHFSAALFRRIAKKGIGAGAGGGGKWRIGAALIYQIRCAIVHAGEKDMIFESFSDGEEAVRVILPHVERAALLLVGINLL